MWRRLYRDHWLLGALKDTMPRRKWLKSFNFRLSFRRFLCIILVFALISLSFPIVSLSTQDETSEPTYDELMTIFGEEDLSSLTVDDAAWDALLGVMKKWTDFLVYHACDPTKHPWLSRLQNLGKLLSLRTIAQAGEVFSEGDEWASFFQVSQTLDEAAWDTLEQLILIGMATTGKKALNLPAGNGYFIEVIKQADGTGQGTGDDSGQYPDPIPEPGGGEVSSGQTNRLYIAQWLVKDSEGNTLESSSRLIDLAFWIEPEALTSWDFLIPTPAEICDCQTDFSLGEEEDDGRYLADEWYFSLYMEGDGDPQRDYLQAMGMGLKGGVIVGVRYKVIPLPEGARPQVIYKEAPSTCQRGRGRWVLSWSLPDGSSWEMDLLLEAPPFEQDPPPPKAMEHHWLEWWDEIGQSCKATPYVADGLKVTKWLDFAAETAMGFLPCGGVVVLIKRYWMGQEVGWIEWSDAALSCIPYLGRLGGLALRGFAGSAKWFLSSRKLNHLAEGKEWVEKARRLGRGVSKWLRRGRYFTSDQQALIELAREASKRIRYGRDKWLSHEEATILIQFADEVNQNAPLKVKVRVRPEDVTYPSHWKKGGRGAPHIHIHIWPPGYQPPGGWR